MGRFEGGFENSSGSGEKHDAICTKCGKQCKVPFKPTEGRHVFCGDCYKSNKKSRSRY